MKFSVFGMALCFVLHSQPSLSQEGAGSYKPSLGDMMATIQIRHSKLWYAASLENWVLAKYELEQLVLNFEQVKRLYPNAPASDLTETDGLTALVGDAINAKDKPQFEGSFDRLTDECNGCHYKAGREFITMRRPALPSPYSNQLFAPSPQ